MGKGRGRGWTFTRETTGNRLEPKLFAQGAEKQRTGEPNCFGVWDDSSDAGNKGAKSNYTLLLCISRGENHR